MVDWQARLQPDEPEEDGMAPDRVMAVMERLVAHQEKVEKQERR